MHKIRGADWGTDDSVRALIELAEGDWHGACFIEFKLSCTSIAGTEIDAVS